LIPSFLLELINYILLANRKNNTYVPLLKYRFAIRSLCSEWVYNPIVWSW